MKRTEVGAVFGQKVGVWINGIKGWNWRKYRSNPMSNISAGGKFVGTISLFTDSARLADRPSDGVEKVSGEENAAGPRSTPI